MAHLARNTNVLDIAIQNIRDVKIKDDNDCDFFIESMKWAEKYGKVEIAWALRRLVCSYLLTEFLDQTVKRSIKQFDMRFFGGALRRSIQMIRHGETLKDDMS